MTAPAPDNGRALAPVGTDPDVAARVFALIAAKAGVPPESVDAGTTLEALDIDSLDLVELVFELEEAFDVAVPDTADIADRFRGFRTAGSAADLVAGLVRERASSP